VITDRKSYQQEFQICSMQVLNRHDKEQLVIMLHQEGKTMRDIASAAHMSFGDIKKIIQSVNGEVDDIDLSNKSKATQAMFLFKNGKKPIDVAIELDLPESEVYDLQQEFYALNQLYDLSLVCMELKHDFDPFITLFKILKKNRMLGEKYISQLLRYACHDLPTLENRIRKLRSDFIDLEFKKKESEDTLRLRSAQLLDLGQTITKYQNAIDSKKQQ
jgi:hypothetical protein